MSALAIVAPAPRRRQHAAIILALWFATASLIGGQYLLLRSLGWLDLAHARMGSDILIPSPWWRATGTLLALLLAGTTLVLQRHWLAGLWSDLAWIGLCALVPFAALCLSAVWLSAPSVVQTLHVRNGGTILLATDEGMDDAGFALFEEADPGGFVWRRISGLDSVEDPPRAGLPHLIVSPDGNWLLVRRDGIWTDGFRLVDGHATPIAGHLRLPDDAAFRRPRSERIAALTGLRP